MRGEHFSELPLSEKLQRLRQDGLLRDRVISLEVEAAVKVNIQLIEEKLSDITSRARRSQSEDLNVFESPGPLILTIKGIRTSDLSKYKFEKFPKELVLGGGGEGIFYPEESLRVDVSKSIKISSIKRTRAVIIEWNQEKATVNFYARIVKTAKEGSIVVLQKNPPCDFEREENNLGKVLALSEFIQWAGQIGDEKTGKISSKTA